MHIGGMFCTMPPREAPRLLFVHAHPDDETLTTGGTIAHYTASGADVHVVTCTLGEEGEVIGERTPNSRSTPPTNWAGIASAS